MYKLASKLISFLSLNLYSVSIAWADNCSGGVDCLQTAGYNAGVAVAAGTVAVGTLVLVSFDDDDSIDGDIENSGGGGSIDGDIENGGGGGSIDGDIEKHTDTSGRPQKFVDHPLGLPEKGTENSPDDGSSSGSDKNSDGDGNK